MGAKKGGNNPIGKGGFQDHPEHINRAGGPRKGTSFSEVFKACMDAEGPIEIEATIGNKQVMVRLPMPTVEVVVNGKKVDVELPRKIAFWYSLFLDCLRGEPTARRLMLAYHDGLPLQSLDVNMPTLQEFVDSMRLTSDEMDADDAELKMYMEKVRALPAPGGNGGGNGDGAGDNGE